MSEHFPSPWTLTGGPCSWFMTFPTAIYYQDYATHMQNIKVFPEWQIIIHFHVTMETFPVPFFIGTGSHSLRKWTFPCKPLTSDFIHRDLTKKCFWTANCWSFFQPHVILKLWPFSIIHKCDTQKCKFSKLNHTVLLCDSHIVNRHYFHVKKAS